MKLKVNGVERPVAAAWQNESLLSVLREQLGLTGARLSCGIGQCGACVVHLDGRAVKSCNVLAAQAGGSSVLTIEGLGAGGLHPVQKAFSTHHGLQCGFCTPGQVMSAVALLRRNPSPTRDEARNAMAGNLCRCGAYHHYLNGVMRAAREA